MPAPAPVEMDPSPLSITAHRRWNSLLLSFSDIARQVSVDDGRMVYIVAHSPESPAAAKVMRNVQALSEEGITIAALFSVLPKRGLGSKLLMDMAASYGAEGFKRYVRLLPSFPTGHEPQEFVRMGRSALHCGKPIDQEQPSLSETTIFDTRNRPDHAHASFLAFQSFWMESLSMSEAQATYFTLPTLRKAGVTQVLNAPQYAGA